MVIISISVIIIIIISSSNAIISSMIHDTISMIVNINIDINHTTSNINEHNQYQL